MLLAPSDASIGNFNKIEINAGVLVLLGVCLSVSLFPDFFYFNETGRESVVKERPRYKRRLRRLTRKTVKYVLGICPTGGRAPRVEEAPTHSVNLLLGLDGADPTEGRRALVDLLPGLGQQVPT